MIGERVNHPFIPERMANFALLVSMDGCHNTGVQFHNLWKRSLESATFKYSGGGTKLNRMNNQFTGKNAQKKIKKKKNTSHYAVNN